MQGGLLHDPSINQTFDAGWSSPVARQAHNLKVVGSNPTPATKFPFKINSLNRERKALTSPKAVAQKWHSPVKPDAICVRMASDGESHGSAPDSWRIDQDL